MSILTWTDITQIITAIAALASVVVSILNRGKIQQVNLSLNGRISQLLEVTRSAAHLAGKEAERTEERERKNGNHADD